jgi:hypothetical protein
MSNKKCSNWEEVKYLYGGICSQRAIYSRNFLTMFLGLTFLYLFFFSIAMYALLSDVYLGELYRSFYNFLSLMAFSMLLFMFHKSHQLIKRLDFCSKCSKSQQEEAKNILRGNPSVFKNDSFLLKDDLCFSVEQCEYIQEMYNKSVRPNEHSRNEDYKA